MEYVWKQTVELPMKRVPSPLGCVQVSNSQTGHGGARIDTEHRSAVNGGSSAVVTTSSQVNKDDLG